MKNPEGAEIEALLQALAEGRTEWLDQLYAQHREGFFRWAGRRFDSSRQDLEDAWQEAVFAFYQQVASRNITALRYSVRSWLFAVGARRLLNYHRKMRRVLWKDEIDEALLHDPVFQHFPGEEPLADERAGLLSAIQELSPQCRVLLRERFFLEKSIAEIQQLFDYQSANALSVSLSRCLGRLKEMLRAKARI
ncbi:MAG: sigma-70 family RNA polymerase sigma factor [Saprospiraceae bacterium]|nr:sigma-70 family RNA polymerase sigma factor [Saprospiraceae bacterium]